MTGGRANRFNDSCQGKTPPLQDLGRQEATGGPSQLPVAQSGGHSPPSLSLLQSSCLPFPASVSDLKGPGERHPDSRRASEFLLCSLPKGTSWLESQELIPSTSLTLWGCKDRGQGLQSRSETASHRMRVMCLSSLRM